MYPFTVVIVDNLAISASRISIAMVYSPLTFEDVYADALTGDLQTDPENIATINLRYAANFPHLLPLGWHQRQLKIASVSQANPTIITTVDNHCLSTGDRIWLADTETCPELFGLQSATKISANSFSVPFNVANHGSTAKGLVFVPQDLTGYSFSGGLYRPLVERNHKTCAALASAKAGSNHLSLRSDTPDFPFQSGDRVTAEGLCTDNLVRGVSAARKDYQFFWQDLYLESACSGGSDRAIGGYANRLTNHLGDSVGALAFNLTPLAGQIGIQIPATPVGVYFLAVDVEISLVKQALLRGVVEMY